METLWEYMALPISLAIGGLIAWFVPHEQPEYDPEIAHYMHALDQEEENPP